MSECNDADGLLMVPVCDHMRKLVNPLLFDLDEAALERICVGFYQTAKENPDDDLADISARLAILANGVLKVFRKDADELERIRNVA